MMKTYKLILIALIGTYGHCPAQNTAKHISEIGMKVPDMKLSLINYPVTSAKISDFKGKLLIIDFWATWCGACINFFPTADSLQREFKDQLVILPVTYEDSTTAAVFLNNLRRVTHLAMASVIRDDALHSTFHHNVLPHEVWISPDEQKVIAITETDQVNETNIAKVLHHEPVQFVLKEDYPRLRIDFNKPVLIHADQGVNVPDDIVLRRISTEGYDFILTKGIRGIASMTGFSPGNEFKGFNKSIRGLYQWANSGNKAADIGSSRLKVTARDSSRITTNLIGTKYEMWGFDQGNFYCFELYLKDTTLNRFDIAIKEFNEYFKTMNIEFERETVDEPCYVLRRISDIDRVKSGGGDKVETFNGFGLRFRNVPFKEWISRMEYYYSQNSLPVIDESGINENVDMDLNCSMKDMNALNSELAKYDLKFEKLPRKIGYGVIKSID